MASMEGSDPSSLQTRNWTIRAASSAAAATLSYKLRIKGRHNMHG